MCGIVGSNCYTHHNLYDITNIMSNRGDDYTGVYPFKNGFLGHTRLAIVDLDNEANQPMVFDDIAISFNGEIYNYKELIVSENLSCKTSSDTEVLIRLYQKYDEQFLDKLNGAFSFCIYDIQKDKFFCAKDRYGKKPFYYFFKDGKFIFSSMIKPIIKLIGYTPKLNKIALSQYLQYFVPLSPNTFYQDIFKLEAASYIVYENKKFTKKKYYKINTYKSIDDSSLAVNRIEELLISSVEKRLICDVEVGSLLSGGIDSSLISTIATNILGKPIKTFSVGYDSYKQYSELKYASIVAKNIKSEHTKLTINQNDFISSLDDVLEHLEEPHSDPASIPLFLLTKQIKQAGIKTVLSGEGSDELFLGYDNYAKFLKYYQFKDSLSKEQYKFLDGIICALQTNTKESDYLKRVLKNETIYNGFGEIFTYSQKRKLFNHLPTFKSEKEKKDPIDWMSYIDMKIWLGESLLSKVDKMSMANSIETRNPFLDYRLVNTVFSINNHLKVGDTNKYLLKQIASKYIPNEIITRQKQGFNSPYNQWLFAEFKDSLLDVVLEVNNVTNLFKEDYLKHIYTLAKQNKFKQHFFSLWLFSRWYKKTYLN